MKLIDSSVNGRVEAIKSESLDELWHEAEQIGRVRVDSDYKGELYTAEIMFERRTGTAIYAKGSSTNIAFAIADAINEAREMGA